MVTGGTVDMSVFHKTLAAFGAVVFIGICFTVFDPGFHGADEPVYFAYTSSMVEDGDLNIVNQVHRPEDRFYVSRSFNLPALHNHGGILVWIPFYVYAKALAPLLKASGALAEEDFVGRAAEKCALSFSTVLFGFITMFLSYLLARRFFSRGLSWISVTALFLGTPFYHYMLIEGGNANILAAFFTAVSLLMMLSIDTKNMLHWFAYGVLCSFCMTVKVDLWFQSVLIGSYFILLLALRKTRWAGLGWFIAGFLPGLTMKLINDFFKYGGLHSGELGLINFRNNYFYEQLFSPYRGYFYSSPILIVCVAAGFAVTVGFYARGRNIRRVSEIDVLCMILFAYLCVKLAISSFRFAWGGGNAGARQLLADFPIFVILFARAFSGRSSVARYLLIVFTVLFISWNLLTVSEYYANVDLQNSPVAFNFHPDVFLPRLEVMKDVLRKLAMPRGLQLKAALIAPLIAVLCIVACAWRRARGSPANAKPSIRLGVAAALSYMLVMYTAVTAFNAYANPRNSALFERSGAYPHAVRVMPREYELYEIESCVREMIEYFSLMNDRRRVQEQLDLRKDFHGNT